MRMFLRDAIADVLKQEGVRHVFGQTGSHVCSAWEGVVRAGGISTILNRQEGNGAYMADAYSRLSKRPGVVIGTTGPGLANMTSALANAYVESTALVVFGSGVPPHLAGRNALQDGSGRGRSPSQAAMLRGVTKLVITVPTAEAGPTAAREAFRTALSGRPGPVVVEISEPFWDQEVEYQSLKPAQYRSSSVCPCDPAESAALVSRLFEARRPVVLVGEGADEVAGTGYLMEALRALGLPFLVAPLAKSLVDEYDPLCVSTLRQMFTAAAVQPGYQLIREADVVLLLGSRLQEFQIQIDPSCLEGSMLLQVDPDPDEIGRVFPVHGSVVGSVSSFVAALRGRRHPAADVASKRVDALRADSPRRGGLQAEADGIHIMNIYSVVEKVAPADAVIVLGAGLTKFLGVGALRTAAGQHLLVADSYGPMGYEVPAAMGAALATGRPVICVTGDGSFQMTCNELGTLMNHPSAKVVYLVTNNGGQASMFRWVKKRFGKHHDFDLWKNPNFRTLAAAYGLHGQGAESSSQLQTVLGTALAAETSSIIEARIDPSSWRT